MKMGWKKIRRRLFLIGTALLLLLSTVVPAAASENAEKFSVEDLRAFQEGIVEWKKNVSGGERQLLTGSILDGAGNAGSDWFAFDISRMGLKDCQAAYLSRLKDAVERMYQNPEESRLRYLLSDWHRIAITVKACGGDPTSFGTDSDGNSIDLIRDSVWNSIWGEPGDQGINGYIWALLAVDSGEFEEPEDAEWTRDMLISELLSRQLVDGGFGLIKTDPSDVDLTSMVLTALAPYRDLEKSYTVTNIVTEETLALTVTEVAEPAFDFLASQQQEDGSMITYDKRTSESTSWAMIALASWGRDPESDVQFIQNGNTLLDGLYIFRLEDGGVIHSPDEIPEETEGGNMAGYQAFYGLEAVIRLKEGKPVLFDLSDAPAISEDEIREAEEALPELVEEEVKTGQQVEQETGQREVLLTAAISAGIVLVVMIFLAFMLKDRKKKGKNQRQDSFMDEEDEDW